MKKVLAFYRGPLWGAKLMATLILLIPLLQISFNSFAKDRNIVFPVVLQTEESARQTRILKEGINDKQVWNITNPTLFQKLFFPDHQKNNPLLLLGLLLSGMQLLFLLNKLNPADLFQTDITVYLRNLMLICIALYFIDLWMYAYVKYFYVSEASNGEYQISREARIDSFVIWIGVICGWLARFMKRGHQLQQEQNLTV